MEDDEIEAVFAQTARIAANRLAAAGGEYVGWLLCLASQFPPPTDEPTQDEIDRWFSPQH